MPDRGTREFVRECAQGHCEYCLYPESAHEWPFHVDHIVAKTHRLNDDPSNLAWACTQCNLHKGTNFASIDPDTLIRVDLFNPRQNVWSEHFRLESDARLTGITAIGRATVHLLDMNGSPQLELRRELLDLGLYG